VHRHDRDTRDCLSVCCSPITIYKGDVLYMPQGTLANLANSAFVRTPPLFAERIVRCLLSFPQGKTTTVLDPTAGEGDLLLPCREIPLVRLYGVEISAERTAIARARLPQAELVTCAFEGVSLPKGSMSLVLANPPYFFQDGKRAEYRILADAGTLLVPGGVLVAILPARSAWDGIMINHWCRWYDRVRVWKFPDRSSPEDEGAFEDFTQICVVGIRRAEPRDPIPAESRRLQGYRYHTPSVGASGKSPSRVRAGWEQGTPPPELPITPIPDPYPVPESLAHPHILVRHAEESMLLAALERTGAHLSPTWQTATEWREEGLRDQPVMPLSGEAHVAAEVLTGLLDGEIVWGPVMSAAQNGDAQHISQPGTAKLVPHLLTAFVGQEWVSMPVESEEREKLRERGVVRVAMRQWQDKPILGVLNLATGETRYEQGEAVFTFLQPWLSTLAARVVEKRQPLYRLDPADWELRVVSQFGRDKQLPNAAFPGLSLAQQHRVYAMGRALDASGRSAIQGEPGTGKTRLAVATAARQAYSWRHRNTALFRDGCAQPAWVSNLRRAWLKNPRTLALLGLTPVHEVGSGRVIAYRRKDGTLLPPEAAGPQALPVLVSTPKKVTKEYAAEVRAAWPEAEVVFLERHSDIPKWMQRCAESRAPAVIAILSHSLTRAFGREWQPVVREKQITRREPVMEPEKELLPQFEPVYDGERVLTGYRWRESRELYTQEVTISRFYCPDCGDLIRATPGRLHEREQRPDQEESQLAALKKGQQEEEDVAESDSIEPVSSRTWFTIKPRWCGCRADARNRPGPRNPPGRARVRTPLWTDARIAVTQRKHPQLPFAAWSAAVEHMTRPGNVGQRSVAEAAVAYASPVRSAPAAGKRKAAVSSGLSLAASNSQGTQRHEETCYITREPLPDSFSPYDYLYRFYRGCVALAVIDESHNGRGRDTDIAHAHHQAMLSSQTRMLTSGTHYGGDILGFYHYWFRYHPQFWRRLGLGWNDADKALSRYGVIQEWTKEYESDARKGSGQTSVQVSTIPAPGLSAKLIPYLLEDMVYLTVLDVGAHMPPRIEIPEIVPMRDPQIADALTDAEQARREATRQLAEFTKEHASSTEIRDSHVAAERERLQRVLQEASEKEQTVQAWAEPRHLAVHYGRLVRALDDLARKRNTAARLAKGTVPRWFAVLPCERPFEVWETRRDRWGDTLGRSLLVETERLSSEYLYPLERRLIALVQKELSESRRVMVYFEQNDLRSMARRLEWVLKDVRPWTLPNSVAAEDRQQAILQAVQRGHRVVIVPYRRVNEGLNLQSGIDTILWVEMALNLFMLDQASRRAWRLGKREEVRIYYLAYANTAGHTKLRKLGQQSGAAAAFAGEPARGALIEHAGADKTTLARLSSLLEQSENEDEEEDASVLLTGESEVAEEEAALKAVFARRAEELRKALVRGREWLGGMQDDLAERFAALAASPVATSVWAARPHPLVPSIRGARKAVRVEAEQQGSDSQREPVIPLPAVTTPVLPVAALSPVLPAETATTPPAVAPTAEPALVLLVGSRAEVVFGRDEHIALARVRSRARRTRGYGEPLRRRIPVSEREIPSLTEEGEIEVGTEEQGQQVAMPSLWDLLVAPTSGATKASPPLLAASSHGGQAPHQSHLWE
jgi:SAM-dependent methyltransferase